MCKPRKQLVIVFNYVEERYQIMFGTRRDRVRSLNALCQVLQKIITNKSELSWNRDIK